MLLGLNERRELSDAVGQRRALVLGRGELGLVLAASERMVIASNCLGGLVQVRGAVAEVADGLLLVPFGLRTITGGMPERSLGVSDQFLDLEPFLDQ